MSEVVRKRALDEDSTSQEGDEGRDSSDHSSKRVAMDVAPQHDVQDVMVMKLLCPSTIVGAIIGRGGSVLHGFQSATNTTIRISQNNEYFPETSDRVVAMTGQPDNVKAALTSVIDRMCESILSNDAMPAPSDPRHPLCVRLLIPHAASGVVIGRGGSNIKETSTLTDTRMQLSDSVDPFNTKERIVSISGAAAENIKNAALIVLEELLENRTVGNFVNVTPTYHIPVMSSHHSRPQPPPMSHVGMGGNAPHHMQYAPPPSAPGAAPPYTSPYGPSGNAPPAVMTQIGVPDQLVGVIVGKGGNVLRSIIANSGASIKVSQKGDFIAGTTNRSITIEGSQQQVNFAHAEIMTCISNHEAKNAY